MLGYCFIRGRVRDELRGKVALPLLRTILWALGKNKKQNKKNPLVLIMDVDTPASRLRTLDIAVQ